MVARESFRAWLIEQQGFSRKVAADALSRCRRVEKVLDASLDATVLTGPALDAAITRLWHVDLLGDTQSDWRSKGGANLIRALRLYAEFVRLHPNASASDELREAHRAAFRNWLASTRGIKDTTIRAVISRCLRIERMLGISLDESVGTREGLDDVIDRLRQKAPAYIVSRTGSRERDPSQDLRRAAQLYHDFMATETLQHRLHQDHIQQEDRLRATAS